MFRQPKSKEFVEMSRYSKGRIEKEKTMVGLKTFWILISALFLLAACVPQTKQTECGANEAFNASLRTCVPIVGGPSSFINVSTYTPQFTQTRYKDDPTTLVFTIAVSNPYNQSYSVEWVRVFNAAPASMCGNALTCSTSASFLGNVLGEIGTHIITAKIKDGNGTVVDSHNFELKINELPRPIINTASLTPAAYALDVYPTDANVNFSFQIKNNNATISALDGYKTTWTVVKNGSTILTENDSFSNFSASGTNTAFLGTSPVSAFDPDGASFGVGSYIIRAVVQNTTPGEVVDEHQWNVIVKQPDLANVTNVSSPAPGVSILAHNNVDYNDYPTYSWVYSGTKPTFCVNVDDRDGTYAGDGLALAVKFYLDGAGGDICTKRTVDTPGTDTVCLLDANPCVGSVTPSNADATLMNSLKFTNASSTVAQGHTVVARIFDERTTYELQPSDVLSPAGLYPIVWNVLTNPVNVAPVMSFGSMTNVTSCVSAGAFTRSNCKVNQGDPLVTVTFTVTDDFYSPSAQEEEFMWDFKLKMNGADISTPPKVTSCSKALGATVPAYTTNWSCTLEVPHYIASGALNPAGPFQIIATMQDSGSPVGGISASSQSLTWNLIVTETNSIAPNILISAQANSAATSHISRDNVSPAPPTYFDPAGTNFATEMETVTFRVAVRDPELDDFDYKISVCGAGSNSTTCNLPQQITSNGQNYLRALNAAVTLPFVDTVNTDPVLINALLYALPETLLLDAGSDVDKVTSVPVYFKVDVSDRPSALPLASVKTDSEIYTLYVRNYNPAPVINTAGASPAANTLITAYPVMAGFPFSINPGSVSDASVDSDEGTIAYQWYATGNGGATWSAIAGATQKNLTWTPDHSGPANIELKLCVGDRAAANPILAPNAAGNCSTPSWFVAPKSYLVAPTPVAAIQVGSEVAVWNDPFDGDPAVEVIYSAYIGTDKKIYVNKVVRDATGTMNISSFQTVSFDAVDGAAAGVVTNISLSGTTNSLYIAYGASVTPTPTALTPRIRRIDKSFTAGVEDKSALAHKGRFGFAYADFNIDVTACTNCTKTAGSDSARPYIDIASPGINGGISINGYSFTADGTPTLPNEICDLSACPAVDGATSLATKINASIDPLLQGITAEAAGNRVYLNGMNQYESIVINQNIGSFGMGKIFVVGSYWFVPIINASLAGAQQNNITILSGQVDLKLQNAGVSVSAADVLTTIGQVAAFDAQLNANDDLVIASISGNIANAGRATLSRFDLATVRDFEPFVLPAVSQVNIFGTKLYEEISLASDTTGNPSIYVMAKERVIDGGKYYMGRHAADLSGVPSEALVINMIAATDSTPNVISDTLMTKPTLIPLPNSSDARIFFNSVGTPAAANATRVARWKSTNVISCGTCAPIGLNGTTSKITVTSPQINTTIGTTGYLANENQKDVAYFVSNYLNGVDMNLQLGLINLESEIIQSTTVDSTNHLWRPPFAK
jgi:hypothetical protein